MQKIKELRLKTGLSQAQFAAYYHIPLRSIENWEEGKRKAPPYVIELLGRVVKEDFGEH